MLIDTLTETILAAAWLSQIDHNYTPQIKRYYQTAHTGKT